MKKPLSFILFSLVFTNLFGQNLHLTEILKIKEMEDFRAQKYLSEKGWKLDGKTNYDQGSIITMVYHPDKKNESPEAYLMYNKLDMLHSRAILLTVKTFNGEKYERYLRTIKARNGKLIKETRFEGHPSFEYDDGKYYYQTFIEDDRTPPRYNIMILDKNDRKN